MDILLLMPLLVVGGVVSDFRRVPKVDLLNEGNLSVNQNYEVNKRLHEPVINDQKPQSLKEIPDSKIHFSDSIAHYDLLKGSDLNVGTEHSISDEGDVLGSITQGMAEKDIAFTHNPTLLHFWKAPNKQNASKTVNKEHIDDKFIAVNSFRYTPYSSPSYGTSYPPRIGNENQEAHKTHQTYQETPQRVKQFRRDFIPTSELLEEQFANSETTVLPTIQINNHARTGYVQHEAPAVGLREENLHDIDAHDNGEENLHDIDAHDNGEENLHDIDAHDNGEENLHDIDAHDNGEESYSTFGSSEPVGDSKNDHWSLYQQSDSPYYRYLDRNHYPENHEFSVPYPVRHQPVLHHVEHLLHRPYGSLNHQVELNDENNDHSRQGLLLPHLHPLLFQSEVIPQIEISFLELPPQFVHSSNKDEMLDSLASQISQPPFDREGL